MIELRQESFGNYSLITPTSLPTDNASELLLEVEKILFKKHQHIVISLKHVESLFSVQLSSIIQVYKILQEFNLRLILCDLSYGIVNVLEMTQMTNLMTLYISRDDFEGEASGLVLDAEVPQLEFLLDHQVTPEESVFYIKGFLVSGPKLQELKVMVDAPLKPVLDLSRLGFIDKTALIFLSELAKQRKIKIRGATSLIEELLEEEGLYELFEFDDDFIE
jgi:anti-anti-sigma factor